jgi:nucleoside 2-deoxyribosyltransferase
VTTAYLAGPDVFRPDWERHAGRLRAACARHGIQGVFPLDNDVAVPPGPPRDHAYCIRQANLLLIERSDIVLANVSPFRGPHADDGTAFEVGYATARHKPVLCYSVESDSTLLEQVDSDAWCRGDAPRGQTLGEKKDHDGWSVEDFGLPVNLMLVDPLWGGVHPSVEAALEFWSSRKGIV